jgi:hypothetical protein
MGYAIAAYVVVLGALFAYGLRLQAARRALARREAREPEPLAGGGRPPAGAGGGPPAGAGGERPGAGAGGERPGAGGPAR